MNVHFTMPRVLCEHGRRRSRCKECGGSSICEHGRVRSKCKECGGGSICEHGRRRSQCKECKATKKRQAGHPAAALLTPTAPDSDGIAATPAAHATSTMMDARAIPHPPGLIYDQEADLSRTDGPADGASSRQRSVPVPHPQPPQRCLWMVLSSTRPKSPCRSRNERALS